MKTIIRTAIPSDLPQIIELYKELQPGDPPVDLEAAMAVWEQAAHSGVTYFVAECDGNIAATCCIAIIPNITKQCKPIGFIEHVVTASRYQRLGIGRKLLDTVIEYAKTQGCYKVTLQSGMKRTEAHGFYEAMGFNSDSKRAFEIRF